MSRRAIPYVPNRRSLAETTVAIVSVAGVHLRADTPFNTESDCTPRLLPGDVRAADLMVTHTHYDTTDAQSDPNVEFPIDRLRELAEAGAIAGIARQHGTMGYCMNLRLAYDESLPNLAEQIERTGADAVLLTAGCPSVCHRTVVAAARDLEMLGLPTVIITVSPDATRLAGPPRALYPRPFEPGNSVGRPNEPELQRRIVLDALELLTMPMEPGTIVEKDYSGMLARGAA